jgi:HK97 family phage major capsid protein/HK97 family phage prohead protease
MQRKTIQREHHPLVNKEGFIEGYASVFDVLDYHNERILPKAFRLSLEQWKARGEFPKMLWQHDMSKPIGVWDDMVEDEKGLYVKGRLLLSTQQGREAYELIQSKAIEGLSIGFDIEESQCCPTTGICHIIQARLQEVSLVTLGANPMATITHCKHIQWKGSVMNKALSNTVYAYDHDATQSAGGLERVKYFKHFLRNGAIHPQGQKALSATDQGFLIPQEISEKTEKDTSPFSFRHLCSNTRITTDSLDLLVGHDAKADVGWMQETDQGKETNIDALKKIHIPVHQLYAKPRATQKLLDDACINIEEWLMKKVKDHMTILENEAFLTGDGKGKPRGILSLERTKAGHVESGKIESFKTTKDGIIDQADVLIQVFHSLQTKYLSQAVWIMSRSALSHIRLLKDKSGHFLFQTAFDQKGSGTLLGHRVYVVDEMPQAIAGVASTPVLFGNFKEAYHIAERSEMTVLRDPYSAKPYVEFYVTKRIGGDVINTDAVKCLEFSK